MTRLTAEWKSDRRNKLSRIRLKNRLKDKAQQSTHHNYTNFSGDYPGIGMTKEELAEDLKYAQSVCRQKFW